MKKLEQAVIVLKDIKDKNMRNLGEKEKEIEEMKEEFYEMRKQLEMIPELEIKLKNGFSTIDDIRSRNKELISSNEKLKIDLSNHKALQTKIL